MKRSLEFNEYQGTESMEQESQTGPELREEAIPG